VNNNVVWVICTHFPHYDYKIHSLLFKETMTIRDEWGGGEGRMEEYILVNIELSCVGKEQIHRRGLIAWCRARDGSDIEVSGLQ
jgi:hypothetical protein